MHGKPFLITGGPVQHMSQVPSLQWQCQCPVLVWLCGRAGTAPSLLLTILRKVVARGCQRMVKLQKSSQVLADSQCLCRLWKQSVDLLKRATGMTEVAFEAGKVFQGRVAVCLSCSCIFPKWHLALVWPLFWWAFVFLLLLSCAKCFTVFSFCLSQIRAGQVSMMGP